MKRDLKQFQGISAGSDCHTELEGEWTMLAGCVQNTLLAPSVSKHEKRVTRGNETTVYLGPRSLMRYKFTVDRTKKPARMDCVHTHGPHRGTLQRGIYELDGSMLKLCFAMPGQVRPSRFIAMPGDGRTLTVWTKLK